MVSHPKTPILNCFYHLLWSYFVTVSEFSCLAKSTITPKRVHMKCLLQPLRLESDQFSYKTFCIIHL